MNENTKEKKKNTKKVEILALLATLKEKQEFCEKKKLVKFFPIIYESLPSDWDWKDASDTSVIEIIRTMVSFPKCPKEVIEKVFARKNIYKYDLFEIFSNEYISSDFLHNTIKNIIKKNLKKRMSSNEVSVLTQIAKNPNLSDKDRTLLEDLSLKTTRLAFQTEFMLMCIQYSKRPAWFRNRFVELSHNQRKLSAFVFNPICPDFILSYIAIKEVGTENLVQIVKHPNVSLNTLEILKTKAPELNSLISAKISQAIDDESI